MLAQLTHNWWLIALRGALAIIFAVLAFLSPTIAGFVLVTFFGAYAFIDGIFILVAGITHARSNSRWWLMVLEGLLGIAVGVIVFYSPAVSAFALGLFITYWIGAWAVITGVLELVSAARVRQHMKNEIWLVLSGIVSVVLGLFLLFMNPLAAAAFALYLLIGYTFLFGIFQLALGFRLHGLKPEERKAMEPCEEPC
jgi:uncharacterized membrane protein HdeD (DUF308 family)